MIRLALLSLLALTVLGSAGCAKPVPMLMSLPVAECPAPERPDIPALDPGLPFDHSVNVEIIMERDDVYRAYAKALEDCVECYRAQAGGDRGRN